ncbi:restriction endonuclease subunit S [Nocardiopsis alba]|uniref:restriction endonuclease subunit S n=1 Tax=Nocardiopsis alba TaxID=53437 RepID=UPI0033C62B5C
MSKTTLEEICALIVDCKNRTPPEAPPGEGVAYAIGTPHIVDGRISINLARPVTEETFATWTSRAVPEEDDIILTREAPVGRVARVEKGMRVCLGQRTMLIRTDKDKANHRFLEFLLKSSEVQNSLHAYASGSTVPHLRVGQVRELEIPPLPQIHEQEAIAVTLGALDDKIAANERIAATAIELADARFSREATEIDFGNETFSSVAQVAGGGTPKTKEEEYWGGDIAWTTPTDVTALNSPYLFETSRRITPLGLENCASQIYPANSIFMTSRATIGAFAMPQFPAAVNQGFIVVLPPTEDLRWWLFHEMRSRVDEMRSLANGSTFLELSRKNFKAMPIRMPETEALQRFSATVGPLHRRACKAAAESRTLAELRDTLLPQLMSGKLRVKDAEKIVEDNV